jgi:hypothetical protein
MEMNTINVNIQVVLQYEEQFRYNQKRNSLSLLADFQKTVIY